MEVEVKLRLKSGDDHRKACEHFGSRDEHKAKYFQENLFFDGLEQELSSKRVVLRIRFYNMNEKCVVTVKGKAVLENGIGKASEVEEAIDPILGRSFVENPELMLESDLSVLRDTLGKFGVKGLKGLGGFKNVRDVYNWKGLDIEVDETKYNWGTVYEIECETSEPERIKGELEEVLKGQGVGYEYSKVTKFQNFINQTLD
ncbi:CYTH domain-containing protein [Chloropicon primus]|uniref:CYTH domain-containing protein n=1 Tax=Chloropicon primus TaxID=1764295 RepID=A0A5B8MER6_9CHLO|nr:hypothetical protein A3770_02p11720 [Chloropicon primus]UPQ97862.1 CYTH domain-containing protein [Chloropicon primus]|eukprot:QDZ18654.1 hypothetical protein A3770_02p11720 [Chloropicon primus]